MATKAKTYDWGGITLIVNDVKLASKPGQSGASSTITLSSTELTYLDGITAGTAIASKAMITDSNNDIAGLRKLTIRGPVGTGATGAGLITLETAELTVANTDQLGRIDFLSPLETGADALLVAGSIVGVASAAFDATNNPLDLAFLLGVSEVASEKMRLTSAAVLRLGRDAFAGTLEVMPSTTNSGQLQITCADQAADHSVIWNQASTSATRTITMPDPGAAANFVLSTGTSTACAATSAQLDFVAAVTAGTGLVSKALVLNSSGDVTMPAAGIIRGQGQATLVDGTTISVLAAESGGVFDLDSGATAAFTLPAAVVGLKYTFVCSLNTATDSTITCAEGDFFVGSLIQHDTDTAASEIVTTADGTTDDIMTFAAANGGLAGTHFEVQCISVSQWLVWGHLMHSGTVGDIFSS